MRAYLSCRHHINARPARPHSRLHLIKILNLAALSVNQNLSPLKIPHHQLDELFCVMPDRHTPSPVSPAACGFTEVRSYCTSSTSHHKPRNATSCRVINSTERTPHVQGTENCFLIYCAGIGLARVLQRDGEKRKCAAAAVRRVRDERGGGRAAGAREEREVRVTILKCGNFDKTSLQKFSF